MSKKPNKNDIDAIIDATFEHLKNIVDANTVVGKIIDLGQKMFIIPVSKISVGLISGGGNLPKGKDTLLSAGSGTGFNIVPIGFITIANYDFKFLPVNTETDLSKNLLDNLFKFYENYIQNKDKEKDDEV